MASATVNPDVSLPTAPGGFASSLSLPGAAAVSTRRLALAGATITSSATFGATLLRTSTDVTALRRVFASVVVKEVQVKLVVYKLTDILVTCALVPSNLTAPATFASTRSIPTVQLAVSNSVTASEHTYDFRLGDVPGIEWDLAAEIVRFGHVGILVAHDHTVATGTVAAVPVADVQVAFVVECTGAGFGASVGGTTI